MSTAIVYFSRDNNTRTGAQLLGEKLNAKVVELKEKHKGNVLQALLKWKSSLAGDPWDDIKDADKVYLMCPIWASHGVPAMNAFLSKANLSGKGVGIITFQVNKALHGFQVSHQHLSHLATNKGGRVVACHGMVGGGIGECLSQDAIREQIEKIL